MVHQLQPAFEIFQDREQYFEKVGDNNYPHSLMLSQSLMIMATTFFYGAIMGSYNSPLQAMASGGHVAIFGFAGFFGMRANLYGLNAFDRPEARWQVFNQFQNMNSPIFDIFSYRYLFLL